MAMNYLTWRLQFNSLLIGYYLLCYVNGTTSCPLPMLVQADSTSADSTILVSNPAYNN